MYISENIHMKSHNIKLGRTFYNKKGQLVVLTPIPAPSYYI